MIKLILLWGALLLVMGEATLKNKMPEYLKKFQSDVNAKEAAFPGTYLLQANTREKVCFLTFDDGPDQKNTPEILAILKKEGVLASFFFLGGQMQQYPDITRQVVQEGHLVLPHGFSHRDFRKLASETVLNEEIRKSERLIEKAGGGNPKMFRPPYGAVTDDEVAFFAGHGYRIVNWSIDSFDWTKGVKAGAVVDEVLRYVHPGAVILLHSGSANKATPKAVRNIIQKLKAFGYRFERVDRISTIN